MIGLFTLLRVVGVAARRLWADPEGRGLVLLVGAVISGGAVFYRVVEQLSWVDSFYLTVVTLTTVGYGDISPQTTAGKIFTMFYLLIGIGLLVTFITEMAGKMVEARASIQENRSSRRRSLGRFGSKQDQP